MEKRTSTYILVIFIMSFVCCKSQENKQSELIKIPNSFKILGETEGDLDKDGISEKIVVYDTEKKTYLDRGTERQIFIYKKKNDKWEIWKKSIGAILPSEQGMMMGEPFRGISVVKNCIVINHFGGNRKTFNYTHTFKYQNADFHLIRATVYMESQCDNYSNLDYNLSNGKVNYKKVITDCEKASSKIEKEKMIRKLEFLPTMNGFYPGNTKMKFPKSETTIYY
ncbi:hypothetical protein M4I21_12295 [Cellulophaga sp. 20_2_10]|uniref:hypothetical protein n=1 Tax=Cellulophaga sp. 20_2_10 TaxID=2942476 RepID=UPI00201A39C3|nr:hypothetical protein [Cellulophaga sp. 20_2_10]MCL5246596.1 hypothetical protein [Cellulophaga sp. 20_2_10]